MVIKIAIEDKLLLKQQVEDIDKRSKSLSNNKSPEDFKRYEPEFKPSGPTDGYQMPPARKGDLGRVAIIIVPILLFVIIVLLPVIFGL